MMPVSSAPSKTTSTAVRRHEHFERGFELQLGCGIQDRGLAANLKMSTNMKLPAELLLAEAAVERSRAQGFAVSSTLPT